LYVRVPAPGSGLTPRVAEFTRPRRSYWGLAVSTLAATLIVTGCRKPAAPLADVTLAHRIVPDSPKVGPAQITLTLRDAAGQPISGAAIRLEGNMSHPGMVPVFAEAWEEGVGSYRADLEFTMAGDWFLLVEAALPDGRKLERQVDVLGVKPR
jgi:hypothetical protein